VFCESVGPPGVHVHVDRYLIKDMQRDIPESCASQGNELFEDDGFAVWLRALFTRKDEMMQRFKKVERLERKESEPTSEEKRIEVKVCPKLRDWMSVFGVFGSATVIGRGLIWLLFA
jgi:hypothetical protein